MRKSAMERLVEAKRKKQEPTQMTTEDMLLLLLDGDRPKEERTALPTQRAFVFGQDRINGYMGPAGCAKTSTLCAAGWLRALMTPGSKGLVARANYNDLMDTTGLRMTEMLNRLPKGVLLDRDKSPPMKWWIQSIPTLSPEGDIICEDPAQITFMGLQDGLGSYEFDWAIIDEVAELKDEMRVHEVNSRLRNKPKSWPLGFESYWIGMAFNPPDKFHWLYRACTGLDPSGRKVASPSMRLYLPKPNENLRNLPTGYYEQLAKTMPEDMRVRLVEGQWGSTFEGQPVYREFKFDLHTKIGLEYDPHSTMYLFWDFGYRRPAAIWAQVDFNGRLRVLREHMGENLEIVPFIQQVAKISNKFFPNHREFIHYGDPAARQKKDTGSTLTELTKAGIILQWKISTIDEGLRVGRMWLEKIIDGEPAILFDRQNCPILIEGMRGGYHLDDTGQKPKKDGYYDHLADAFRYGLTNVFGTGIVDQQSLSNVSYSVEYDPRNDT